MILKRILLTTCLIFTLTAAAFAQSDSVALTTVISKVSKYSTSYPVEKVFLHFDKPYYAVGDTIWVKAYVTTDLHIPSPLSKIVYIDFTDGGNNLVAELKLQLINGFANGYQPLPTTFVKPGNYHVRAYTRW